MKLDLAIDVLDKVLIDFRKENRGSFLTIGETLQSMTKEQLIELTAKLLLASSNVVQSRL